MADPAPIKPKSDSHLIPVVTVILAMSAFVCVYAYSQWPAEKDDTVTPVVVNKTTNTTVNTNEAANSNTASNTNGNTSTNVPSNIFSFASAKVGDHVAGMTITKIGKYRDNDTEPNYRIEFSGQATIKGQIVSDNGMGATVTMHVTDPAFQRLLPRLTSEDRSVGFAFSNEDFAITKFPLGTDSEQSIVIDHFILNDYPSEVVNMVDLVSVVSSTADWKTYTNSANNYSLMYPRDWTAKTINDPYYNGKAILSTLQNPGFQEPYGAVGGIFVNTYANNNISETLNSWFAKNREVTEQKKQDRINNPCTGTAQVGDMITAVTDDTVNGLPARVQYEKDMKPTYCEGGAATTKAYYIKKGTIIFEIMASSPTSNESDALIAVFDQVMNTFTFTK